MTSRHYDTPAAFKQALETRLRTAALQGGVSMNRLRQKLVFERFLVRVFAVFGEAAILKGGIVIELRLSRARATKDVDLRMTGSPTALLERLQAAGRRDERDHLSFKVDVGRDGAILDGESMKYEGYRFRVEARLAGRPYGDSFGVDVAFGDVLVGSLDVVEGIDILAFAGIPRAQFRIYPRETHIAEKLHAYTLPRERENSRVKDLPDLALLAKTGPFTRGLLHTALEKTFTFRNTHPLPASLPSPPPSWANIYERMAREDGLPWATLADVTRAASAFLNPVLGPGGETWSPSTWSWQ